VISVDTWAEVRRLHRSEGLPIKEIARRLDLARNTVRAALRAEVPPPRARPSRGSVADAFEPAIRAVLLQFPRMPATVIAERIEWPYSITPLKRKLRTIRPEYVGVDPADRLSFAPGEVGQLDLWQPDYGVPVGFGQQRKLWVLAMTLGYSRMTDTVVLPGRLGGDLMSGMWLMMARLGRVPRRLVWDRESAIAGGGRPTALAATFFGTLGVTPTIAPRKDPEFKGMIERSNRFFETSFLPGRMFGSQWDLDEQLVGWLGKANQRAMRRLHGRPVDYFDQDRAAMLDLPPLAPAVGLTHRIRLGRDYYVRLDSNDYSVDPAVIGRFVDVTADLVGVEVRHEGRLVGAHNRVWARGMTITDPVHVAAAKVLREQFQRPRPAPDPHEGLVRDLTDYDRAFGITDALTVELTDGEVA
jgi:transposase